MYTIPVALDYPEIDWAIVSLSDIALVGESWSFQAPGAPQTPLDDELVVSLDVKMRTASTFVDFDQESNTVSIKANITAESDVGTYDL